MLDATETDRPSPDDQDWRQSLSWGDVVSFRFPRMEGDPGYRPKARPCVVLDTVAVAGKRFVTLGYGTSADTTANRGYEVRVESPAARARCGIRRPTRFVCSRRITVSDRHPGFCRSERGTPVVGRLAGPERRRLNAIRARIFAETDIAAELRARRRARSRSEADGRERPLIVEYRRPRAISRLQPRAAGSG